MDVIGYGDPVTAKGLNMLYGPGNDLVSATAMTAAGAHMILFTTGREPLQTPAPTLKLATNSQLAEKRRGGSILTPAPSPMENPSTTLQRLLQLVIETADGKQTDRRGIQRDLRLSRTALCCKTYGRLQKEPPIRSFRRRSLQSLPNYRETSVGFPMVMMFSVTSDKYRSSELFNSGYPVGLRLSMASWYFERRVR